MQDAIRSSSLGNLNTTLGSAVAQTNTRIAQSQAQVTQAMKDTQPAVEGVASRFETGYNPAVDQAATANLHYQQGLAQIQQQQQQLVQSRVSALSKEYGGSAAAMALMNAAGVTSAQITDTNNAHWAQALIEIQAQKDALGAMATGAGEAGAAMNALGGTFMTETLPAIQKVTQAESSLMSAVLGGEQAFISFQQSIGQAGNDAKAAGASIGGLNSQSLTLASDYYSTVLPGLQKLIGAEQQQGATTKQLTTIVATGAKEALGFAGKNDAARESLVAMINNALGPGTVSLQDLNTWVKNNATSQQGFRAAIDQTTVAAGKLAGVLQSDVTAMFAADMLQATGADQAMKTYTYDLVHFGANAAATQGARAQLIRDLEAAGYSAQQATAWINGLSTSIVNVPSMKTITFNYQATGSTTPPPGPYSSGYVIPGGHHAAGWKVPGYGGGDTVPAWLEPGEAVVPKHLVPYVAPFLGAHHVPGFAEGTRVGGGGGHHGPAHPRNMADVAALWAAEIWRGDLHRYGSKGPIGLTQMAAILAASEPGHGFLPRTALAGLLGFDERRDFGRYYGEDVKYRKLASQLGNPGGAG